MKLAMVSGDNSGWGICTKYLDRELSKLPPLPDDIVVHAIAGPSFQPAFPQYRGRINIGYCFFEDPSEAQKNVENAKFFDWICFGSSWNTNLAKSWGLTNVSTLIQGVDTEIFRPIEQPPKKEFIVGSFGKFEYRKGQDIVIAAMREFMEDYQDVVLSAAWYNFWKPTMDSMADKSDRACVYVRKDTCMETIEATLEANGIDMDRVRLHPALDSAYMADLYRECDVAVFPNRVEGGTNLCLMEAMACGVPVIANKATGQADVLVGKYFDYASSVRALHGELLRYRDAEFATMRHYDRKDQVSYIRQFTWERTAKELHDLASRL